MGGASHEIYRLGPLAPPMAPQTTPLSPPSEGRTQGLGSSLRPSWGCTVRIQVRRGSNLLENVFEVRPPDPALLWGGGGDVEGAGPQPFRMPSAVQTKTVGVFCMGSLF